MDIVKVMRKVFLLNECGGDPSIAYEFSDADGVRTGKSGYSFGLVQFDTLNNAEAIECLRACEFTESEIKGIINQTVFIDEMNKKILAHKDIVDAYDNSHTEESIKHCENLCKGIPLFDEAVLVHIVDYHNQFYMSPNGKLHRYLKDVVGAVKSDCIIDFKLCHTKWGREHSDDVLRRARNIRKVLQEG